MICILIIVDIHLQISISYINKPLIFWSAWNILQCLGHPSVSRMPVASASTWDILNYLEPQRQGHHPSVCGIEAMFHVMFDKCV